MNKLRWYVRRLAVMRPAEIVHRLAEALRLKRLERSYRRGDLTRDIDTLDHRQYRFCTSTTAQLPDLPFALDLDAAVIEQRLRGQAPALGFPWAWVQGGDSWHRAPDSGQCWPRRFFGVIDYRQGNPYGDARVIWEPGRLQQLLELALIARQHEAAREAALTLLSGQLRDWLQENPPACGIHYVSAMECALRLVAVCHAADLVRSYVAPGSPAWRSVAQLVHSHAPLVANRVSLHSSSGNHTVAECVGLLYAGLLFPEMSGASDWFEQGLATLSGEAERQVLPDGGGIERSTWYHLFVIDLLGLADELLRFRGCPLPAQIKSAVARGRRFLRAFGDSPADLPRLGDNDDGYALSPHLRLSWQAAHDRSPMITFEETGYTVIRLPDEPSAMLVLDHGPLGMAPSFGHGHADALSVWLSLGGAPLLIDPGTFTYTGDPAWRRYFRGTAAHNTVRLDGEDQARQETAFQWSGVFHSELTDRAARPDGTIHLRAQHDGYRRQGVTHQREVVVLPDRGLIVVDQVTGQGSHISELFWHLSAPPNVEGDTISFGKPHEFASLQVIGRDLSVHSGEADPPAGWQSVRYGVRTPTSTLRSAWDGALPHHYVTIVNFDRSRPIEAPELAPWIGGLGILHESGGIA